MDLPVDDCGIASTRTSTTTSSGGNFSERQAHGVTGVAGHEGISSVCTSTVPGEESTSISNLQVRDVSSDATSVGSVGTHDRDLGESVEGEDGDKSSTIPRLKATPIDGKKTAKQPRDNEIKPILKNPRASGLVGGPGGGGSRGPLPQCQQVHPLPPPAPASAPGRVSEEVAAPSPAPHDDTIPILLLSLPVDSLHCIASFLPPQDWSAMSQTGRGASRACREVFRRVRMHGFRCATEAVTAWMFGQHADARELTALYIKSGVPIYPLSLGHSYHTLTWRMGVEAREMENQAESADRDGNEDDAAALNNVETSADTDATTTIESGDARESEAQPQPKLDRFYAERYEARSRDGYYLPAMSYLEEKSLFWRNRRAEADMADESDGGSGGPGFGRSRSTGLTGRRHSLNNRLGLNPALALPGTPPAFALTAPPADNGAGGAAPGLGFATPPRPRTPGFSSSPASLPMRRTLSSSCLSSAAYLQLTRNAHRPKTRVEVHRHLADQHLLGCPAVDDDNGAMRATPVSLSADFFHPQNLAHQRQPCPQTETDYAAALTSPRVVATEVPVYQVAALPDGRHPAGGLGMVPAPLPTPTTPPPAASAGLASWSARDDAVPGLADEEAAASVVAPPQDQTDGNATPPTPPSQPSFLPPPAPRSALAHSVSFGPGPAVQDPVALPPLPSGHDGAPTGLNSLRQSPAQQQQQQQHHDQFILSDVELVVYSSSSSALKRDPDDKSDSNGTAVASSLLRSRLRARFDVYQRRLDSLLSHYDSAGFDECLLDFWEEFLPLTSGIHFFDRHTPVPRQSGLMKFLTKPCPKSVGIVQCEIQRIKIPSKKKGVSVKGRLFPSYEYRLFIRDRRHALADPTPGSVGQASTAFRRDTVLMTAKNKGRNHQGPSGASPSSSGSSKRGVNNYYLYMPQPGDVMSHLESVNKNASKTSGSGISNAQPTSSTPPVLLGRLQSNFIGTEFQIFSPAVKKVPTNPPTTSIDASSDNDSDLDYDSGGLSDGPAMASPSPPSQKKSLRRRLSTSRTRAMRRGSSTLDSDAQDPDSSVGRTTSRSRRKANRRGSWPSLKRQSPRTNRVSVTSAAEPPSPGYQQVMCEEDDGAITYTANLLGNRPRIMDVCIPKVDDDGTVGEEWRRHKEATAEGSVEGNEGGSASSGQSLMLSRFKQLQQRMDNPDGNNNNNTDNAAAAGEGGNDNADNEAIAPTAPDNYGLLALQNRPPWWNIELGAFVLNFGGRVSVASVKNFQLCDRNDQEHIMLQFGRIQGRHAFTMDFQHPLTAMQAFAIAISSLQSKISFG